MKRMQLLLISAPRQPFPNGRCSLRAFKTSVFISFIALAYWISFPSVLMAQTGKADEFFDRANAFLSAKQNDSAVRYYSRVLDLQPGFANAYYNRGIAYDNLGKYEQAVKDYSKAIELTPENV